MRFETLRTLLAFSAINDLKLCQFDVKGAYLHGKLNKTIYMVQPPGYNDQSGQSCLLICSLYGLKQAGNVWNHELNRVLAKIGFTQLRSDYCCYIRRSDDNFTSLLVWVDDFISASTTNDLNDVTEHNLKSHFDIKSLGLPNLLLGMKVHVGHDIISLSQTHYIDSLLTKFGLADANPVATPMDPNVKLDKYDKSTKTELEGEEDSNNKISYGYAQLIGSLMYLAIATCLDIAFAVNKLAQYTSDPKPSLDSCQMRFPLSQVYPSSHTYLWRRRRHSNYRHQYLLRCRLGWRFIRPKVRQWLRYHHSRWRCFLEL